MMFGATTRELEGEIQKYSLLGTLLSVTIFTQNKLSINVHIILFMYLYFFFFDEVYDVWNG